MRITVAARWRSATCRPSSRCPARCSRWRSSASAGRRGCSLNRCSTRRASACAPDGTTLMGRHPDLERRAELLDEVVRYLGRNGIAGVSLRPVARALGVSVNALVHHFGSKDELVVAALRRAAEIQRVVEGRWRRREPRLSTADLQRRWWRWINRSPEHLALVRLGLEAATLDATISGLPGDVRAEQISFWREGIADGLIADGIKPEDAEREASLVKATFTGLVLDLLATGQRKRLTDALNCTLARLENLTVPHDRGSKLLP